MLKFQVEAQPMHLLEDIVAVGMYGDWLVASLTELLFSHGNQMK